MQLSSGLRNVPDEYARCRVWNHSWDFTTVDRVSGEWIQGLRCVHCGTERSVKISRLNGKRTNRYVYPEDISKDAVPYKMPKGSGGALSAEERGLVTIQEIRSRYDELSARRRRRRRA